MISTAAAELINRIRLFNCLFLDIYINAINSNSVYISNKNHLFFIKILNV